MEQQHTEEDFKNIAKQLACPEGEHGIKTAENMHTSNSGMTHAAIDEMDLLKGEVVLEIGHGNGGHIAHLLSKADDLTYSGADISETIIAEAEKINRVFVDNGQADFKLTDGKSLPFADAEFDKIFTVNTIYFWENPIAYLSEIKRVLKPNGKFVLGFADKSFMEKLPFTKYGFTLYELEKVTELLKEAGFKNYSSVKMNEQINSNAGFMVSRDYYIFSAGL